LQFLNFITLSFDFFTISILSIPVAFAIFLGYDFALTNRTLAKKIVEFETLSEEKQQILATQNETLERQVAERTAELKASQAQLIQKEKLASLGELTAGIAHEIQNPLNFVNNFSELSVELAQELKEEVDKPELDKELINDLVSDLSQNQEKINLHGKRAASIVKGMLEHSRTGTGERQLTDINQLADEYLRLSYHGLRAKDSQFNSDYELISDENLPKINVVPQEIGRVLLNLINNAFYAVNERSKLQEAGYKPKITVITKAAENQIEVKVQDNGTGMSEATKAKIFQPFFTTKPTGEGTGLGLSLAYDIVTKGHGGAIEVESVEGEGTTFVVQLPILA
jgi:signal transduction histidine kinase